MTNLTPLSNNPTHSWLKRAHVAFVPGPLTPLLERASGELLRAFRELGHVTQDIPDAQTDVLLTSAPFGQPLGWRQALLFTARARFKLPHAPMLVTLMHVTPAALQDMLARLRAALSKRPPDPADFAFEGLAPQAWQTLVEQGQRGGPIMALERVLQSQAKGLRIILFVGEDVPQSAYHFDLVGAFPRSDGADPQAFYRDIVLRIVTNVSTHEVTEHQVVGEPLLADTWRALSTPPAMQMAARQLGQRDFFTKMVRIADLVQVPAVADSVASQYSEGCFATWEPALPGLVSTVTGSARPINKEEITVDDLAIIVGMRPDGQGALVRHIEGGHNMPPSSEAVEMLLMDRDLPRIALPSTWGVAGQAPVIRSKLHVHRGLAVYDPRLVEYAPLDAPYYHYPVSCATEAQAHALQGAFRRSEALRNPEDPRQLVFTVLPCHGVALAEKWVPGKAPFQLVWEYVDAGHIRLDRRVPQGPMRYERVPDGRMRLSADSLFEL